VPTRWFINWNSSNRRRKSSSNRKIGNYCPIHRRWTRCRCCLTTSSSTLDPLWLNCVGLENTCFFCKPPKRLQKLLIDSEETISEIVRITTSKIDDSAFSLPSCSSLPEPTIVRMLEEVALYEGCIRGQHNILEEDRVQISFSEIFRKGDHTDVVSAVQTILRTEELVGIGCPFWIIAIHEYVLCFLRLLRVKCLRVYHERSG